MSIDILSSCRQDNPKDQTSPLSEQITPMHTHQAAEECIRGVAPREDTAAGLPVGQNV